MDALQLDKLIAKTRKRPEWDRFSRMTAMDVCRDGPIYTKHRMGQDLIETLRSAMMISESDPTPSSLLIACLLDEVTLQDAARKLVEAVEDDMSYEPFEEAA